MAPLFVGAMPLAGLLWLKISQMLSAMGTPSGMLEGSCGAPCGWGTSLSTTPGYAVHPVGANAAWGTHPGDARCCLDVDTPACFLPAFSSPGVLPAWHALPQSSILRPEEVKEDVRDSVSKGCPGLPWREHLGAPASVLVPPSSGGWTPRPMLAAAPAKTQRAKAISSPI